MPISAEQIDRVAQEEGWFHPAFDEAPFTIILRYIAGELSLQETVAQLTTPINSSFTSANSGNAIRRSEQVAASQRSFHTEASFHEQWGDPLPEHELPAQVDEAPSTEGQLWELWYAVLHAAKRSNWREESAVHKELVSLVREIKNTPDPPPPERLTKALQNNWIWSDNGIWSDLRLLGPSSREMWNDSPGCGASYSETSVEAWANVNAFVARLTAECVREYWIYAIWAMRDALEESDESTNLNGHVPAAAPWIFVLEKQLYEREEDLTQDDPHHGDPARPGNLMRRRTPEKQRKSEFSKSRWGFWKLRFHEIAAEENIKEETKAIAMEAYSRMSEIEQASERVKILE